MCVLESEERERLNVCAAGRMSERERAKAVVCVCVCRHVCEDVLPAAAGGRERERERKKEKDVERKKPTEGEATVIRCE